MTEKEQATPLLVPVDFSDSSKAALEFAAELAACLGNQLLILHVVHDPGDAPGFYAGRQTENELKNMEDVAAEMMEDFMQQIREEHPDLGVLGGADTLLLVGLPVSRILEAADKHRAKMVIMGSKGRTGLSHILLGSKAEQIVRLSPIPVTIVKADAEQNQ